MFLRTLLLLFLAQFTFQEWHGNHVAHHMRETGLSGHGTNIENSPVMDKGLNESLDGDSKSVLKENGNSVKSTSLAGASNLNLSRNSSWNDARSRTTSVTLLPHVTTASNTGEGFDAKDWVIYGGLVAAASVFLLGVILAISFKKTRIKNSVNGSGCRRSPNTTIAACEEEQQSDDDCLIDNA